MKRIIIILIFTITLVTTPSMVFAQGMMGSTDSPQVGTQSTVSSDGHTAREEQEGKEVWEKLQSKQLECKNLTDEQYDSLGEYFMGKMAGEQHETMNTMMIQNMGKEGEEQMHIAMGKRMSGCEPNAPMPQNMPALSGGEGMGGNMMSMMMNMMMAPLRQACLPAMQGFEGQGGGGNSMMGTGWGNMMGGWNGFGVLGWIPMLLFWILLILGVVALFRYLGGSTRSSDKERSPLDILKERYAKGEIDKKEFEEMKKVL